MLAVERQKKIMELLLEHSHIEVGTLSSIFGVSEVTIRKDLEKMEQAGIITRLHGSAVLNVRNDSAENRVKKHSPEDEDKAYIGKICSELIYDNDIVFIGAGSTCWNIINNLKPRKSLTIITNNITALPLIHEKGISAVIAIGGSLDSKNGQCFTHGVFAENMLSQFRFTKAFVAVSGIDKDFGISLSNPSNIDLYRHIKNNSREFCVVSDASKFNNISMLRFCDISDVDTIITSSAIADDYKRIITESGVRLYTTISSEVNR